MDTRTIPQHIAIIMDGNGRRAKERGLPKTTGHKQGAGNIRRIAIACDTTGVKALTYYASSTENWKRPQDEVDYLCELPKLFFSRYLAELKKNNVKVTFLREIEHFPDEAHRAITTAVEQTQGNMGPILCLAVNYGSHREIILAAQRYTRDVQQGKVDTEVDKDVFGGYVITADMLGLGLMTHAGGELRTGNFLLWQLIYAELILTPMTWPDFSQGGLNRVTDEFSHRNRRFGGL